MTEQLEPKRRTPDDDKREQAFYDAGYSRKDFWHVWCAAWKASRQALSDS